MIAVDAHYSLSHVIPNLYDIVFSVSDKWWYFEWVWSKWWQTDEFWSHTSMYIYSSWLLMDHFYKHKISPWSRGIIPTHIFNAEHVLQSSEQNGVQTSQICLWEDVWCQIVSLECSPPLLLCSSLSRGDPRSREQQRNRDRSTWSHIHSISAAVATEHLTNRYDNAK